MKKIGFLVAVEMDALLRRYGTPRETRSVGGFEVHCYADDRREIYAISAGAGEIAAAAATALLIGVFQVDLVLNYGVVGGLSEEMKLLRSCVVERVVHYDFDTAAWSGRVVGQYDEYPTPYIPATPELVKKARKIRPELRAVTCASADKFVATPEAKRALYDRWGADICEMEAAGIVLTCNRAKVPCLLIKTVSDGVTGGAEEFHREMDRSAALALETADAILEVL